jgi:hypothetical protein
MNKKRWVISLAAFAIILAIATPFSVKAYQDHRETVRINDQFDEAFSKVIGYSLLAGRQADLIGLEYDDILTNSDADGAALETLIDQKQSKLIATGKYDKANEYFIKLAPAYNTFKQKSTRGINYGKEKKEAAKSFYDTVSKFYSLVNNPKPNFDYALKINEYQKAYFSDLDKCIKLQKK